MLDQNNARYELIIFVVLFQSYDFYNCYSCFKLRKLKTMSDSLCIYFQLYLKITIANILNFDHMAVIRTRSKLTLQKEQTKPLPMVDFNIAELKLRPNLMLQSYCIIRFGCVRKN